MLAAIPALTSTDQLTARSSADVDYPEVPEAAMVPFLAPLRANLGDWAEARLVAAEEPVRLTAHTRRSLG